MVPQITIFDSASGHCFFVLSLSIDNTMNNIPCFVLHKVVYLRGLEEVLTCNISSFLSELLQLTCNELSYLTSYILLLLRGFSEHFA